MSIKTRANLKVLFKNGTIPSEKDFCDLIDSALIKRDDQFFGKWKPGLTYYEGDVVIYNKTLYMLQLPGLPEDCQPETPDNKPPKPGGYCSTEPPSDNSNWCMLQVEITDDDWVVTYPVDEDGKVVMHDNNIDLIAIGHTDPKSTLHIKKPAGEWSLNLDKLNPSVSLINSRPLPKAKENEPGNYLLTGITNDKVVLATDSRFGISIRKGASYKEFDKIQGEVNKVGGELLCIHPDGKVGIGKTPGFFELEVKGETLSYGNYIVADPKEVQITNIDIGSVMTGIESTNPVKYKYLNRPEKGEEVSSELLGFDVSELADYFPEVVRTEADETKTINYEAMTAILFKAVKELKSEIDLLKKPKKKKNR